LADPGYKGDDYMIDPELQQGPLTNRRCTDCLCLIIFLAAIGAGCYVGYFAAVNGDPELLVAPIDSDGNFCGKSVGYENYPLLYYQNIDQLVWFPFSVCVASCPQALPVLIPVVCKPTTNTPDCNSTNNGAEPYNTIKFLDRWCLPDYSQLPVGLKENYDNIVGGIGLDDVYLYVDDIIKSWPLYCIGFGSALALVFLWNIALRLFAECLAYICIMGIFGGLIFLGWFVKEYGDKTYPEGDTTKKYMDIMAYTCWVMSAIFFCIIMCAWESIQISITILRTSAKVVSQNLRVIFVPILGIFAVICWIVFFCYSMIWLFSCGEIKTETIGTQVPGVGELTLFSYKTFVWNDHEKMLVYFSLFCFLWICAFIMACTEYVQIVAVASWYFSQSKDQPGGNYSICRGYWWMLRYNLGSLAFGSFLIAVVVAIRLIFEYIDAKMKASGDQGVMAAPVRCLMKVVRCCLDCCHRFVKYINKNAYCQVVLTGESFCTAAINGFLLILKHSMTFAFTGGVGFIFTFIGKFAIAIGNTIIIYFVLIEWPTKFEQVNSPVGPLIVAFLISYVIAALFMDIYTTTGIALMHCLFADIDICKQMNIDEFEGTFRPQEMNAIVKRIAKPKGEKQTTHRDSMIN
jgi:choline transporter-like protein 2/4/5